MANKKISELTALGGTPANDDVVPVVDTSTSTTKKVTVSNLLASKADSSHTHAISDVTNLQTSLDAKQAAPSEGAFVDGDKTKLDGIEASADVTDATNVEAAGALMDSELTDLAGVKGVTISTLQPKPSEGAFSDGDKTKLDGIATGAEVNVQSDWDATSGDAQILNKPTIPSALTDLSNVNAGSPSDGQVLKWNNSASEWQAMADYGGGGGGSGTVTSVAISGSDGIDVDSGSPITSSGTIALGLSNIGDAAISSAATWNAKQDAITAGTGLSFTGNTLNAEVTQAELDAKPDVAGSDGQIQFNSSGSLGADSNLVWDGSNDRLGIGTNSPAQKLEVVSSANGGTIAAVIANKDVTAGTNQNVSLGFGLSRNSGAFKDRAGKIQVGRESDWTVDDANIDSFMAFYTYQNNAESEKMRISANGNVGIGATPSSSYKLLVNGGICASGGHLHVTGSSSTASGQSIYAPASNTMALSTNSVERMRIDAAGNVKVGSGSTVTANTDADDLVIDKGASDTGLSILSTTTGRIYFGDAANNDAGSIRYAHSDDSMRFETDDTERMRIDSSGNLGLGTTSPSAKLHVAGQIMSDDSFRLSSNVSTPNGNTMFRPASNTIAFGTDSVERMRIDSSGRVGISESPSNITVTGLNQFVVGTPATGMSSGNTGLIIGSSNSGSGAISFLDNTDTSISGRIEYDHSDDSLYFRVNNQNRMQIASSGRVTVKKSSNAEVTALTDGATITPDLDDANNFSVTLGGNRTLANPSNCTAGQSGIITITQDGTGSRTLAYGSYWKFSGGTAPTLTTTASAVDVLAYYVESATRITATLITDTK